MTTEFKKYPLAIAWDDWIASDEGQRCTNVYTLPYSKRQYLENRLQAAFNAGARRPKKQKLPA